MTDVFRLFSQHPEWKKIVFLLDREESVPVCARLIHLQKAESYAVVTSRRLAALFREAVREKDVPAAFLRPGEELPFSLEEEGSVLFFDRGGETLFDCLPQNVRHVAGVVNDEFTAPFAVWERFRESAASVDVISYERGVPARALRWTRPESGVELSVIFPVYNVAPYLEKCIRTVTEWQAPYVEFLFVDDGSPDNSSEIIEGYAARDPRIRLIHKENGGCASARQKGLEEARGRYIGFIDPDDFVDPSLFRKLLQAAMVGSYEIAFAGYNEYYESTGTSQPVEEPVLGDPYCYGVTDPKAIVDLITYLRVAIWRGIYSRALLERGGIHFYTDIRRFDDLIYKMEVYAYAKSVVCVPEHLYYYRMNRPGQDVAANDERLYVHFPIFRYLDATYRKIDDTDHYKALQICKLFTHIYAVQKLKPEFLKEYCRQARTDFRSLFSYRDSKRLYRLTMARGQRRYFRWIYHGFTPGLRLLKARFDRRQRETPDALLAPAGTTTAR